MEFRLPCSAHNGPRGWQIFFMRCARKCGRGKVQTKNNTSMLEYARELSALIMILVGSYPGIAQQHQQLWLDYQLDLPFANQYLFEVTTSYQTVFTDSAKWRSMSISPVFEYQYITKLDFLRGISFFYTDQNSHYHSF